MTVSDEELRWVISRMVAKMLTTAGDPEQRDRLKRAVRDWFPNQDKVDEFELRRLTEAVAAGFHGMANLVDERLARLLASGKAVEPDGHRDD